ncbi:MAG: carboxyl-terminal protease [Algoriphagus sp. 32-45-6]|nr:MAG: carboxyl-terminal protease [Algoriphagus sp. 32-45-6]
MPAATDAPAVSAGNWVASAERKNILATYQEVKKAIFDSMREWYYWTEELPTNPDLSSYSSNEELLDDIIFKPLDRFSYLTTQEAFTNAFVGRNAGHGFGFAFTADEKLYVSFVFDEAPAGKDGWQRGWEITQINGQPISSYKTSNGGYDFKLGPPDPGISNSFTFKLPDGTTTTRTNVKAEYQSNSVLDQRVIDVDGKKVGYWAYQSFKATAGLNPTRSAEVQSSMEFFQAEGIQELIIDLRYNGGGSVAVAEQIMNYLIQPVINSLDPYMDLILIGDNTFGKPVGSFPLSRYNNVLQQNNVELVPITFATANSEGKAEYFEGFPANFTVGDTPNVAWGDPADARLNAAIQYIRIGNVSGRLIQDFYKPKWEMIDAFQGLQQEFPVY